MKRQLRAVDGIREHDGNWMLGTYHFKLRLPVARKAHRCTSCDEPIDKGTQYVRFVTRDLEGPGFEEWVLHGECYLDGGAMFDPRPAWRWPR
jgi:hypothetical protein